ncbi:hypothetical protein H0H93_001531 [Arthromyces matolae]|nr:hypothetical protein H0H93_001531 [Arthromyces matolae]
MPSYKDLGIPSVTATVDVRAFDVAYDGTVLASAFMTPVLPGFEAYSAPMYAFLIEHKPTGKRIMFDLGPRKDTENSAPGVLQFLATFGKITFPKDIIDLLTEGGIHPESINAVIWSHSHFDHTGDMSKFPGKTQLFIGKGTARDTYPTKTGSSLLESDFR